MIQAIVLAAGRSRRMGTQKLLLPYGDATVIGHIVDELLLSRVAGITAVVNPQSNAVADELAARAVAVVSNPDPHADMLSSVRCGLRALPPCAAVLVALGDQPSITGRLVDALIERFREGRGDICVPLYQGKRGHPLLFADRYREEVLTRFDDVGLRGLPRVHPEDVVELRVTDPAVLSDMDTPDDYRREVEHRRDAGPHPLR
jgi:molybdenum cofactor cytidylyltransferase